MRKTGFYWVRFKSSLPDVAPEIAFWRDEQFGWMCSGQNESCNDLELEVLSERLEPPVQRNAYGCRPKEDVCIEHDEPLVTRSRCGSGSVIGVMPLPAKAAPKAPKAWRCPECGDPACAGHPKASEARR